MPRDTIAMVQLAAHLQDAEIVALAEAFGGTRLYVPVKMTERNRIAKAIGMDAALRLWEGIGVGTFRVPLAREVRVRHYRAKGLSTSKIARKLGITETGVSKLLKRCALVK